MSVKRGIAEGVLNIVRFNWPFFAWSVGAVAPLLIVAFFAQPWIAFWALIGIGLLLVGLMIPLIVSFYVYDLSGLYELSFLKGLTPRKIVNLTAGFDETTKVLRSTFSEAEVLTFDFYNEESQTEPSIRRARKLFPLSDDTLKISTSKISLPDGEVDLILGFLSLHEVRNVNERVRFLKEINRILAPDGSIIIVEHLRDVPNFLAYSIGFFHFHSRRTWQKAFTAAGLSISQEECLTPFLRLFKLTRQ